MIRVILVDDEILARLGLRTLLEEEKDISIQEEFGDPSEALNYLEQCGGTDIVITDIEMSGMNGLDLIHNLLDNNLALGVVIVSCHADFRYAQDAIKEGAGAYLLKQDISGKDLSTAVRDVYEKAVGHRTIPVVHGIPEDQYQLDHCVFAVGVIQFHSAEDGEGGAVDEDMLVHLLENIIKRNGIGTLFLPYKRDMFILFQFPQDESENERRREISGLAEDISENVSIYINRNIILGVSDYFTEIKDVREQYDRGEEAASLSFYRESGVCRFYENRESGNLPPLTFSTDEFLDENGCSIFHAELCAFLDNCSKQTLPVDAVRRTLSIKVSQFIFRVLQEYRFQDDLKKKWNQDPSFIKVIEEAENSVQLEENLTVMIQSFQMDLLTRLKSDEMQKVLQYIDENAEKKISLQELADMSYMSTSTFCKKFKQTTGMTLVQYINQQKIKEVKALLLENHTLEEIADRTGFLNVNYMIRVFKHIEGKTVTEYRKDHMRENVEGDKEQDGKKSYSKSCGKETEEKILN